MPPAKPASFAHVVYRTRRFEEMIDWYETVFGAQVQYRNPALAFLTYDDEHHRFALANLAILQPGGSDMDRQGAVGVDHVAYGYPSVAALLENYAYLKEKGITPYWCVHHGVTVAMYYADPDANQMEFQVDCFPTKQEALEFMNGPQMGLNPIGVEFDPDHWLARLRADEGEADFLIRPVHEPVSPLRGALSRHMGS